MKLRSDPINYNTNKCMRLLRRPDLRSPRLSGVAITNMDLVK
jgi:hypothetical protein